MSTSLTACVDMRQLGGEVSSLLISNDCPRSQEPYATTKQVKHKSLIMTVNNSICVIISLQESTMAVAAARCRDGGAAIKKREIEVSGSRKVDKR